MRAAGHAVRYQSVKDPGWDAALKEPADLVAVAGGDGTVSRVAKRMVGRGIPLAPLPSGTANNISRTLGLMERAFEDLVQAWPKARRVKLDVGVADGPWGKRYFVEGIGIGLFTCMLSNPRPDSKLTRAAQPDRVAHALQRLLEEAETCRAVALDASVDGKDVSGRYLLFEALNILYVGPNLFLAPDSQPGDGTFELVLVTEAERDRLQNYLVTWQTNRERLSVLPSHRGKHLHIESSGFELHIDDQLWPENGSTPPANGAIDVRLEGAAVEFLAPGNQRTGT